MISPRAAIYPNWGFQFCQLVVIDFPDKAMLQTLVSVRKHIQFSLKSMTWKMAKMKSNVIVMQNEGGKQREFFFSREWSPMAKCPHTSTAHPFVRRQKPSNYSPEPAVKLSNRTFSLGNLYHVITVSPVLVYQSTISSFFLNKIVWVYTGPSYWQPSLKVLACLP